MGGLGSGNWYRWDKKSTCEEVKRIDIRVMKKQGWLEPGLHRSMYWESNGESTGNINYQVTENALILSYRSRSSSEDDWKEINETVWFDRSQCNFGGERRWFRCPHCGRRVAVLYGLGSRFLCRHCYGLTYSSQQENYLDRMMRRARKIRKRLGASVDLSAPIWIKPKGMHQKTFQRLVEEERRANQAVTSALADRLGMFDSNIRHFESF